LKKIKNIEVLLQKHHEENCRWEWKYYTSGQWFPKSNELIKLKSEIKDIFASQSFHDDIKNQLSKNNLSSRDRDWFERLQHKAHRFTVDNDAIILTLVNEVEKIDDDIGWNARLQVRKAYSGSNKSEIKSSVDNLKKIAENLSLKIVKLFSRKEQLARHLGFDGYVDLALKADGIDLNSVKKGFDFVDRMTQAEWNSILGCLNSSQSSSILVLNLLKKDERISLCKNLSDCKKLWNDIRNVFHPYLDDVEVHYKTYPCNCNILKWPDDLRIFGYLNPAKKDYNWGISDAATLLHEAGHALHYKMLGKFGKSFRYYYITPVALEESITFLTELLLFQSDFISSSSMDFAEIKTFNQQWRKMRIRDLREQLAFAVFDMEVYKLALESPKDIQSKWLELMLRYTEVDYSDSHWSTTGYGFYTEDPVRRYSYILAGLWAKSIAGDSWQGIVEPINSSPSELVKKLEIFVKDWISDPDVVIKKLNL